MWGEMGAAVLRRPNRRKWQILSEPRENPLAASIPFSGARAPICEPGRVARRPRLPRYSADPKQARPDIPSMRPIFGPMSPIASPIVDGPLRHRDPGQTVDEAIRLPLPGALP